MKYKSFTDMPVWEKAHELSLKVFDLSVGLPRSEDYGLKSQIRRSANSISANIAEAFGRSKAKDKSLFYVIARGSSYETQNHLIYGQQVGYFKEEIVLNLTKDYNNLIHEINKILKTLHNQTLKP